MSIVDELEQKLKDVSNKASGDLSEVADKVQEAFHKLVEDDGVADEVTEKVAHVLKAAADKLDNVADRVHGLFESDNTVGAPGDNVIPARTVTEEGQPAPGFESATANSDAVQRDDSNNAEQKNDDKANKDDAVSNASTDNKPQAKPAARKTAANKPAAN